MNEMTVRLVEDAAEWNRFVIDSAAGPHDSFLQSWEWGQMQKEYGWSVYYLGVFTDADDETAPEEVIEDGGRQVGAALCIVLPLPFGRSYLFSPRGPLASGGIELDDIVSAIRASEVFTDLTRRNRTTFWRMEPMSEEDVVTGARRVHDKEPATTLLLDTTTESEELMKAMKQKTRYNIRLSERKEVEVEWHAVGQPSAVVGGDSAADDIVAHPDWDELATQFHTLLEETSGRHGIRNHPVRYYQTMFRSLGEASLLSIATASYKGAVLAMNIFIHFGDTTTYLHGASTHKHKKVMAPYALQWAAIQRAQQYGHATYDFFGIAPQDGAESAKKHPLAGVTRFKTGFAGTVHNYPGTFELPISVVWYSVYHIAKLAKRIASVL